MDHQACRNRLLITNKSIGRLPLRALARADARGIHAINFLQTAILGLHHEEVDDKEECKAAAAEDKTIEIMDRVRDEGREEGDQEVEEPV